MADPAMLAELQRQVMAGELTVGEGSNEPSNGPRKKNKVQAKKELKNYELFKEMSKVGTSKEAPSNSKYNAKDDQVKKMLLFPSKFNIEEIVKGQLPAEIAAHVKTEELKDGRDFVDNVKSELEKYLYQNMKDGEQANEKVTKKAALNTKDFEPVVIVKDIHYRLP